MTWAGGYLERVEGSGQRLPAGQAALARDDDPGGKGKRPSDAIWPETALGLDAGTLDQRMDAVPGTKAELGNRPAGDLRRQDLCSQTQTQQAIGVA